MPLYEFQCAECDRTFEELVRSSSAVAEVKCPECGSDDIRRKVSLLASRTINGAGIASTGACAPSGV